METESHEPLLLPREPREQDEPDSPALATDLEDSFFETRRLRHDGWDGPAMATFCRALAETGVVTEACRTCGKSAKSAYALRQREPLFARAWESALTLARERLADDLLARSLKGSAEQIVRDGCIWGERHAYDNKLAFAILRRLDRRAELGATFRTPSADRVPNPVPAVSGDWQLLLDALGEDRTEDAALLLTPIPPESNEGNEGNNPPVEGVESDDMDDEDLPDPRIWWEPGRKAYRTNFPAPDGSDCNEHEHFGHRDYHRSLTDAEAATMAARDETLAAKRRTAAEMERDAFFAGVGEAEVSPHSSTKTPPKPPKSEPLSAPDRSERGVGNPGEFP
ncbi:MAG: hypothetical protein ABI617_01880 [Sphingomicrobium sp.]